ncbi:hypothetical protein H5410_051824 [Solanum commersonii]|uniref:Uncharacterized protein n=1 Tax=Solanum commersonii TaxID=4109 RepID=A0A9J5X174_SOLCO|nr:hypothetical protein H5410_051824 [Solanum commersonii]
MVKQALATCGDTSSESENDEDPENTSMLAIEGEHSSFNSLFDLIAKFEDEDMDEITWGSVLYFRPSYLLSGELADFPRNSVYSHQESVTLSLLVERVLNSSGFTACPLFLRNHFLPYESLGISEFGHVVTSAELLLGSLRSYMMEFGLPYLVKLQGSLRSYMMEFGLPYLVKLQEIGKKALKVQQTKCSVKRSSSEERGIPRIELGTSRTLSENHTTRPNALLLN